MTAVDFMYRSGSDMLISCPQCRHEFPLCCPHRAPPPQPLVTLQLPPEAACTVTVHPHPQPHQRRVQVGMTGGGIVRSDHADNVILHKISNCGGQLIVNAPQEDTRSFTSSCGGRLIVNPSQEDLPSTCRRVNVLEDLSPSTPVEFVIPGTQCTWDKRLPLESDLERLTSTVKALRTSGWYYEGLSWQESAGLLAPTSPGTFLVRDSSDPRFLFSLSVQTERGPTSVRLHYQEGHFRLDAAQKLVPLMPVFRCVVELVQYYVTTTSKEKKTRGREQVWIDCSGQTYSNILLTKPLYQRGKVPGLQHLARLEINKIKSSGHTVPTLELPECLHRYLADYPFIQ